MKECPRWRRLLYWCSLITWLVLLTLEILDVFPRSRIGIGALAAEILFVLCRNDAYDPLSHNRILKGALIVWAVILLIWGSATAHSIFLFFPRPNLKFCPLWRQGGFIVLPSRLWYTNQVSF